MNVVQVRVVSEDVERLHPKPFKIQDLVAGDALISADVMPTLLSIYNDYLGKRHWTSLQSIATTWF